MSCKYSKINNARFRCVVTNDDCIYLIPNYAKCKKDGYLEVDNILLSPYDIFKNIDGELKREFDLSDTLVDIACKLINYRLNNKITQEELADKLGVSKEIVVKLENANCSE